MDPQCYKCQRTGYYSAYCYARNSNRRHWLHGIELRIESGMKDKQQLLFNKIMVTFKLDTGGEAT